MDYLTSETSARPGARAVRALAVVILGLLALDGVAAALVVDGGIRGTAPEGNAIAIVAKAAGATTSSGSYHMTMSVAADLAGQHVRVRADGVIDTTANLGMFTLHLPGGHTLELLTDGKTGYLRVRDVSLNLGAQWVSFDGSAFTATTPGIDPGLDGLGYLRAAAQGAAIERVGDATIRGVRVAHFHFALPTAQMMANAPADLQASAAAAGAVLPATIPCDVWIDGMNRAVRGRVEVELAGSGKIITTVDLFGFGTPVDFALPAPKDVISGGTFQNAYDLVTP